MKSESIKKTTLSGMFLAIALLLPLVTGQIPDIGNMLCPMHIPVLLCGFICGPFYGGFVGAVAPILRFFLFGMPPLFPQGAAMCFELFTYGVTVAILYAKLPKKKPYIFVSLISAMLAGRIVWSLAETVFYLFGWLNVQGIEFGITYLWTQAFVDAVPGIVIQLVLIPAIIICPWFDLSENKVKKH